ncbi:MAG: hypothetical protein ACOC0Z_01520 [Halohasta sp.]
MRVDRRRVVIGFLSLLFSAGCLGDDSLAKTFDLRIRNTDTEPRELSVVVEHVGEETLYDATTRLDSGEEVTEPDVVEDPGRYRIGVTDVTTDEEPTDERHVELSTGAGFCGWFLVAAEPESVTVSVPRCPDDENESADGAESDG